MTDTAPTVEPVGDDSVKPPGLLRLRCTVEEKAVLIQVSGDVDLATAPQLEEQLKVAEAMAVPPNPVVLDLTGVGFLGSRGLSVLIEHHHHCEGLGSPLRVVADHLTVLRVLQVTGLDKLLTVEPNVRSALAGHN